MPEIDNQQQAVELTRKVRRRLDTFDVEDPARPWFLVELEKIAVSSRSEHAFEENSARISALKQLLHLVFEHGFKKQNPDASPEEMDRQQSMLTVQARLPSNVLDSTRQLNFSIEPELLHKMSRSNDQFDPVSPTAKVVSYLRSMDPSLSLFSESDLNQRGKQILDEVGENDLQTKELMAVMFQSRYHAFNVAVLSYGSSQVIEFAAGVSPRGMQWSQSSPRTIYIESDLPQLMVRKAKLIRDSLMSSVGDRKKRGLLHCCGIDVLKEDSIRKALEIVDVSQPITFASEGLLLYFSEEELGDFLSNIRKILVDYPKAVWISDLVSSEELMDLVDCHLGVATTVKSVFKMTGRSVIKRNPFENLSAFADFLKKHGLQIIEQTPLHTTLGSINFEHTLSLKQMKDIVGKRCVFSIRPIG